MDAHGADLDRQITGVATLSEPVRRTLYLYVAERAGGVTRDQAAQGTGITRALAAFHLEKLLAEGLLDAEYRRLTGRSGPGAGRPAKLYRRSHRQFVVTLPPRSYELAARLFARALEADRSVQSMAALDAIAQEFGASLGDEARLLAGPQPSSEDLLAAAIAVLRAYGYEPSNDAIGVIRLHNCPFHDLAREHRPLVCGMNLALLRGVVAGLQLQGIAVTLEPQTGYCCVALQPATDAG